MERKVKDKMLMWTYFGSFFKNKGYLATNSKNNI